MITHPSKYREETEGDGALHVVGGAQRWSLGLTPRVRQVAETDKVQERPEC